MALFSSFENDGNSVVLLLVISRRLVPIQRSKKWAMAARALGDASISRALAAT